MKESLGGVKGVEVKPPNKERRGGREMYAVGQTSWKREGRDILLSYSFNTAVLLVLSFCLFVVVF